MTRTTSNPPPQAPAPPTRLSASETTTGTEFEANQERVEPLLTALHRRLSLVRRSRDPEGFDREALLNLDRDAWGIPDE